MQQPAGNQWRASPEVGSLLGLRVVLATVMLFGRTAASAVLWWVCWYFVFAARIARRASADFLRRLGLPATRGAVHRHLWSFARVALDRLLFLSGRTAGLTIELHGHELVMELVAQRKGALLVGAHLGSFEAMRCLAGAYETPLLVIADFANARRINALLQGFSPGAKVRLLELDDAKPMALLEAKYAVERGELVAILADRATGRPERDVTISFLGARAALPSGPWVLAHLLECPVFFVSALFTAPARYDVYCEPLFSRVELPRGQRAEALAQTAQRYAAHLEAKTRLCPLNWFNFYPFWEDS